MSKNQVSRKIRNASSVEDRVYVHTDMMSHLNVQRTLKRERYIQMIRTSTYKSTLCAMNKKHKIALGSGATAHVCIHLLLFELPSSLSAEVSMELRVVSCRV